ncbi:DUF7344 domain-containing protein [Halorussus salinisoli]|uniref:DUF7344 domain-containing protein n=1 Tax=Halorussus salinisoli TaxID=2558242 RepID=UPI0010C1F4D4|nr:hypothetical protein [Halorussus salinisoli]
MPIDIPELTPDVVFDALRNPRRQFTLAYLRQQDRHVTLTEFARKITAWEVGSSPTEIEEDQVERVRVSLHHSHLPKLADLGLVEYTDDDRHTVSATERVQTIEADMEIAALVDPKKYYTG